MPSSRSARSRSANLSLLTSLILGLPPVLMTGCGGEATTDGGTDPTDGAMIADGGTPVGDGGDDERDAGTTPDGGADDGGPPPVTGWVIRSHPCPGINRTDALMVDDDGSMWIGCGSGAAGRGVFVSRDDGASWEIPVTNPPSVLAGFRALSIHRGYRGLVYVAGEGPAGTMAVSVDTRSAPHPVEAVLTRVPMVGRSFLAGPFVTLPDGSAFADSFNGHDALFRPDASTGDSASGWTDASGWEDEGPSHQILDLVAVGNRFVGVGSTIAEPPYVFLPSRSSGPPWRMTPVQLVSGLGGWGGEMWGVAADESRVVAVGVDQGARVGKIFVSGADLYEARDYTQIDVDPLLTGRLGSGASTWARGVCMEGDRIVVVGELQPLGRGAFVLESTDGGASFRDITPDGSTATWSKCHVTARELVIAGAGTVGVLRD